jgi:alkanesulfonate monooxygenase SsuD/methylene tetrahydromethanopterin reductase-like flavin-dependent oxidoreductase (luciferase family)
VAEHGDRPDYVPSALAAAAMIAGAAPDAELLTAATIAGLRDPESLARDVELVAAGCRSLTVGLVAGYDRRDLPGDRWAGRFRALDAAVAALAGRVPTLVGGSGPTALARAGRAGGWLAPTSLSPEEIAGRAAGAPRTVVVRRWVGGNPADAELPAGTRTPREALVGGGPDPVGRAVRDCAAAGADTVLLGPVSTPAELDLLCADLAELPACAR